MLCDYPNNGTKGVLLTLQSLYCAVPENIHTHPMEGQWKFRGGGRVLKAKMLNGMYCISIAVGGFKPKTFRGGIWIFSGTTHCLKCSLYIIMY